MNGAAENLQDIPAPAGADGRIDDARPVFTAATAAGAGTLLPP
ncbi:MAG: hypothetical protein ACRDLS_03080 [Solirubrobacteraceae bacterium]